MAVREHTRRELRFKLLKRHWESDLVERVLDDLQAASLQSDVRFTEAFVDSRVRKGQGPMRIRSELRDKGVEQRLVEEYLQDYSDEWPGLLKEVHDAKYGRERADSNKELARRARFLESRGFPSELIRAFLFD